METNSGFDIETTRRWVTGVLKDPHPTASAYRDTGPPWQRTFVQITLPVYVAAAIAGFILSWVFGQSYMYGAMAGAPLWFLLSILWSLAFFFVAVFIFDFFAGVFGGTRSYDGTFAALSLAMVPAMVGGILGPLPWIGWLISLAAGIYGLVLAYQFLPKFVTIPDDKRILHFFVSLVVAFLANLVVAGVMAAAFAPGFDDMADDDVRGTQGGGMFGNLERQGNIADQALQDVYDPPAHGRLTDDQVAAFARNLERTAALRERLGSKFENMEEKEPSIGDIFSGVQDAVRLGTAEMEVVKSGGGNWAEHQWVKNQLEVARVQQDGSPAIEHNYALFLEYREQLEQFD